MWLHHYNEPLHKRNKEREKDQIGAFWLLGFMKIPLVSPSLDQKKQNCFGHPRFYSTIVPSAYVNY